MTNSLSPFSLGVNDNIKAETARRGIKVSEVATALRLSDDSVARRRAGKHPWGLEEIAKIATAFGLNPSALTDVQLEEVGPPE